MVTQVTLKLGQLLFQLQPQRLALARLEALDQLPRLDPQAFLNDLNDHPDSKNTKKNLIG